jgi:hypothetical protein
MKTGIFSIFILVIFIVFCCGFFYVRHIHGQKIIDENRSVYIKKTENGFLLIRNGTPFYIKGGAGSSNLKELADIGGNTIRLYDTINLQENLDEAAKYGLAVIVDIPIPAYIRPGTYINEEENKVLKQKIKVLVNKYKNHSALLMWNLGNELNYPRLNWKDFIRVNLDRIRFISTFNECIEIIQNEDRNHPVLTALWHYRLIQQYANIRIFSPELDLVSINVFGGINNLKGEINFLNNIFGQFPYYISEWGSDGYWETTYTSWGAPIEPTSAKKAEQIKIRYKLMTEINPEDCFGSLVFFWGNKHERTNTWFSLFEDNFKSDMIKELEKLWNNSESPQKLIGLEYMLLDKLGASDNLVFSPNEIKCAELKMNDFNIDSIYISWEIYPEIWDRDDSVTVLDPRKKVNYFKSFENTKTTFLTPGITGPYRIFAYVYDRQGYFATTNTPFYVLNPK